MSDGRVRYEYRVLCSALESDADSLERMADDAGASGWELVSVTMRDDCRTGAEYRLFFKRPA
jgi:hypothetical protein